MKRVILAAGIFISCPEMGYGQTTIFLEDFEDSHVFYTTSVTEFTDSAQDYFIRTNGNDITGESFSNHQGSYFFGAQDIDGEGAVLPVTLTLEGIVITDYSSLKFRVYLAEDATGSSEHWDADDYVRFTYRIDGGSVTNLIWVEALGDSTNGPPGMDTDFDGTGDSSEITDTFTQYSRDITGTGDTLDITIEFDLNSGDEDIAIDHIEILGTPLSGIPARTIEGDSGWRLLSFPVTGGTVADISDDTPVQGITGGDNPESDANFYIYDSEGTFEEPANTTTAWGDGLGFALYFFDNTTAGSSTLPLSLDATGSEPVSDVTVTLNAGAANKFTLVGNPFSSNFNSGSITSADGDISDNISFWNDATGSYTSEDRTSGFVISPWQGFWVETADAGVSSVSFPRSGTTSSSSSGVHFSKVKENKGDISFTLRSDSTYDEAIRLAIREYATLGFDRADATKLIPLSPSYAILAFRAEDTLKSVESVPWNLEQEVILPMELIQVNSSGGFTLEWRGVETLPESWKVVLTDHETGIESDLRIISEYIFDSRSAPKRGAFARSSRSILHLAMDQKLRSTDTRFSLSILPDGIPVTNEKEDQPKDLKLDQNYPNPFNPITTISYRVITAGPVNLSVYNLTGQKVAVLVSQVQNAGSYHVNWDASFMSSGVYMYRLTSGGQSQTRRMTLLK